MLEWLAKVEVPNALFLIFGGACLLAGAVFGSVWQMVVDYRKFFKMLDDDRG